MIKMTGDDMIIKNYDVDYEEENPDLRMLGGIRGIKAIKVQREYMPDVEQQKLDEKGSNRFAKYEKKSEVTRNLEESKGN